MENEHTQKAGFFPENSKESFGKQKPDITELGKLDNRAPATDFIVECKGDPAALDRTLQQLGACALIENSPGVYKMQGEHYIMRVFGDAGYIKFAVKNQGYCTIISELPKLL